MNIKLPHLCYIVAFCLVTASIVTAAPPASQPTPKPNALRDIPQSCGVQALSVAFARLGEPVNSTELLKDLYPNGEGLEFGQLQDTAKNRGFTATLQKLSWDQLIAATSPVVLWVNGNHFLTIDPREHADETKGLVRLYDAEAGAQWWTRQQLERIWHGEAMVVNRGAAQKVRGWETCLVDIGMKGADEKVIARFPFRNISSKLLKPTIVAKGCGCLSAEISPQAIDPGKAGEVAISIDLSAKRGFFESYVIASLEGSSANATVLTVRGSVNNRSTRVSQPELYFLDVSQGQRRQLELFVYNNNDRKLVLKEPHVEWDLPAKVQSHVEVEKLSDTSLLGGHAPLLLSLRPGDFRLLVSMEPATDCATGRLRGSLLIPTDAAGVDPVISVPIEAEVTSDVECDPAALMLELPSGKSVPFRIRLASRSGRPLGKDPALSWKGVNSMVVSHVSVERAGDHLSLSGELSIPANSSLAGPITGSLEITGVSATCQRVTVVCMPE